MNYSIMVKVHMVPRDWHLFSKDMSRLELIEFRDKLSKKYLRIEEFDCKLYHVMEDDTLPDSVYCEIERASERIDSLLKDTEEAIENIDEALKAWSVLEDNLDYVFDGLVEKVEGVAC